MRLEFDQEFDKDDEQGGVGRKEDGDLLCSIGNLFHHYQKQGKKCALMVLGLDEKPTRAALNEIMLHAEGGHKVDLDSVLVGVCERRHLLDSKIISDIIDEDQADCMVVLRGA